MVQCTKNFRPSLVKYLILIFLLALFEVDRMMDVLKIKHMFQFLLLLNMRISKARVGTVCLD